jgi:protein-S-isoprenylcysteine O-methyltransferase Ste14
MWSLGKSYGIRSDLFDGHALVTSGVYAMVRHPMYFGIVLFHVGASLSLASALLLAATVLFVVPYTAVRIRHEERVLDTGFPGRYAEYARRVPPLVPFVR